jgi:hypothetical protein
MKVTYKIDGHSHLRVFGYLDFTASILRRWRGDGRETYRHVTIGLRSPYIVYAEETGLGNRWQRLRFGYGSGNLYLGVLYIITTFGRQYPGLEYRTWGPFEWARQKKVR